MVKLFLFLPTPPFSTPVNPFFEVRSRDFLTFLDDKSSFLRNQFLFHFYYEVVFIKVKKKVREKDDNKRKKLNFKMGNVIIWY